MITVDGLQIASLVNEAQDTYEQVSDFQAKRLLAFPTVRVSKTGAGGNLLRRTRDDTISWTSHDLQGQKVG